MLHLLFAPVIALFLFVGTLDASHISYDPYADSVQSSSATGVVNPQNAVGAPDGETTGVVGVNRFIVLDMGEGEEGTGTLRVHYGALLLQANIQVIFLDDELVEITRSSRQVAASNESSTQDFGFLFSDFNKAYRYVRLVSLVEAGFALDAIEALDYIGKTDATDTDGDCTPDRTEQHSGLNPQVVDGPGCPPAATPPGTTPPGEEAPAEEETPAPDEQTGFAAVLGAPAALWNALASWWDSFVQWMQDFFCDNWWIAPLLILLLILAGIGYGVLRIMRRRRQASHSFS